MNKQAHHASIAVLCLICSLWLSTFSTWAGPNNPQQAKSSPSGSTGGGWSDVTANNKEPFTPEQIETMRQSCRNPDNGMGPAMVVIKPGHFWMGSDDSDPEHSSDETPRHVVTIPRPFAVSRCEITVGQFRQFVKETGHVSTAQRPVKPVIKSDQTQTAAAKPTNLDCNIWNAKKQTDEYQSERYWDSTGFNQSDQQPVVCVSYDDTQAYVAWLSQRTGAHYRLLTEAEWEYMARADSLTPRYFDPKQQCNFANGADQAAKTLVPDWAIAGCDDGFTYTAAVAQFNPNAFGMFDVLGNVREWVADCWHDNYQNAPQDGSQIWLVANEGYCGSRVVRGGSWGLGLDLLRSAYRYSFKTDNAYNYLGFRVARAL